MIKTIEIIGKQVESKTGNKFVAYKAVMKDGAKIQCKFRQECGNPKFMRGYIDVESTDCNISRSSDYPTLWISKFTNEREYQRKDEIADLF